MKQQLSKNKLLVPALRQSPVMTGQPPGTSQGHHQESLLTNTLPSRLLSLSDTNVRGRSGSIGKGPKKVTFEQPAPKPLAKAESPRDPPTSRDSTHSSSHARPPRHTRASTPSTPRPAHPESATTPDSRSAPHGAARRQRLADVQTRAREHALHAALATTWRAGGVVIRPLFGTPQRFDAAVRAAAARLSLLHADVARWSPGRVREVYWDLRERRAPTSADALRAISINRALRRWLESVRPEVRQSARRSFQFRTSFSRR